LTAAGLIASINRRDICYDNVSTESFWITLKLALVYREDTLVLESSTDIPHNFV
jgi:hypothetical protein